MKKNFCNNKHIKILTNGSIIFSYKKIIEDSTIYYYSIDKDLHTMDLYKKPIKINDKNLVKKYDSYKPKYFYN